MSDRDEYFERAGSWATDVRVISARSRRTAWTVAGIAVAVAAFEAVALAMLAPLKTVQPITLLVDRQTGYVQALDPLSPKRITADEALTNSYLAQYVAAREGFDRATVAIDFRRVALWSGGRTRQAYIAQMPATNPASPFQRYPNGAVMSARVKSVSRLNAGVALVRFDTQLTDRTGQPSQAQPWIAVVRYRYVDAPMRLEDRLVNPLGFQVTGYRRDAEAPPPPPVQSSAVGFPSAQPSVVTTTTVISPPSAAAPANETRRSAPSRTPSIGRLRPSSVDAPRTGAATTREVPLSNLPMGSPLSPAGAFVISGRR